MKNRNTLIIISSVLSVLLIGALDVITGSEIAFAIFYVIPVAAVSWFAGTRPGVGISIVSSVTWYLADVLSLTAYSHPLIAYWNALSSSAFFVIIAVIVSLLRKTLDHEKLQARTDHLTGAANTRAFAETLKKTISLSDRYNHAFTLIYMDIDNFKQINDSLGHNAGDEVLCSVVKLMNDTLRVTDTVARLGGDEFAILLPETDTSAAENTLAKLHLDLKRIVIENKWPISFSIGAITFNRTSKSEDEIIRMADMLMYSVKCGSKNAIRHETIS